jgi:hypothetical protein
MLAITEKEISQRRNVPVYSPILCADLNYINIDSTAFVNQFSNSFESMDWDYYDVKRKQLELLQEHQVDIPLNSFSEYYSNNKQDQESYLSSLTTDKRLLKKCLEIKPWRRRSVCSFELSLGSETSLHRIEPKPFTQAVEKEDLRSLPRIFAQTKDDIVNNDLFRSFILKIAEYAQKVTPHVDIKQMEITAHFMSVKARQHIPGNNSPEGAHEDGADFIVSACVINRKNITGAKSQVLEKLADGSMVTLFERELQPGEFLFQADTGEEKHYGNDLWHYVTPFYVDDPHKEAWRDIIGFDIVITQPKI